MLRTVPGAGATFSTLRSPSVARLAIFWFGLQVVWGALIGVSFQARSSELAAGWALNAYALIAGCGAAVAAVVQIGAGYASDRRTAHGSRRVEFYIAGSIVAAAGLAWFYAAGSFGQLFAAVMVVQIGMNVATGPYQAALPDFVPDERTGTASSWMAALQSLGNAAGAVLAGLVAEARAVAAGIIASLLASCIATASYVSSLPAPADARSDIRITRAHADLFISRALVYLGFFTLVGYLFFYESAALGAAAAKTYTAYTILIVTVCGAAGAAVCAKPADRMDRRLLASIGGAVFVIAIAGLIAVNTWLFIALIAALAGCGWGAFLTADWALGCRFVPRSRAALALAIWNLALVIPQVLAPVLASLAIRSLHASQGGAARAAFAAAMLEVLLGIAWLRRLPASPLVD